MPSSRLARIIKGVPPRGKYTLARRLLQLTILVLFATQVIVGGAIVEGSLASSRVLGVIPMLDVVAWLEHVVASLRAGLTVTVESVVAVAVVAILYGVLGRAFCGWVCPMDLLFSLFERKLVRPRGPWGMVPRDLGPRERIVPLLMFTIYLVLSYILAYPFFTTVSPVAGATKAASMALAILYELPAASVGVAAASLLMVLIALTVNIVAEKVFHVKRFWCRYVCPIGTVYGYAMNKISLLTVKPVKPEKCVKCNICGLACPMMINVVEYAVKGVEIRDPRCFRCGRCVEACPHKVLSLTIGRPKG